MGHSYFQSSKPPLDNCCAMLRMLIALDTKPTRLSERSICSLSNVLSAYLIDVTHCVPEDVDESTGSLHEQTWCCYLLPSFFLFDRSYKLLNLTLNVMGSSINGNSSSFYLVIVFVTPRGTQVGSINKVRNRVHHLKGREERLKVQLAFFKSNTPCAYWSS
ncbi:hypothetical protein NC652_017337 [Populus alba x Populus x berolinensis]|nr:hypothetical protein NC652_017272 [Populus alba x Populus x berolinensis]KAJ6923988.1 hypothetical protein NC652_017337 [Populus alba x Populus x berolinensis]